MSTRNAGRALCALAALSSAAALVVHLTIGEREIGQALLAADLSERVRLSAYVGWHSLTVLLGLFVIMCLRAAALGGPTLAPVATWIGATAVGIVSLVLDYRGATGGGGALAMAAPQWLFAAPIALFAGIGASLLAYARVPARKRRRR